MTDLNSLKARIGLRERTRLDLLDQERRQLVGELLVAGRAQVDEPSLDRVAALAEVGRRLLPVGDDPDRLAGLLELLDRVLGAAEQRAVEAAAQPAIAREHDDEHVRLVGRLHQERVLDVAGRGRDARDRLAERLLVGRAAIAASVARFSFAPATSFIARVIWRVFLTDWMRFRMSRRDGMTTSRSP
jgi:hypothetical protein